MISRDWEFLWLWCGTEAEARIIGPFDSPDDVAAHLHVYRESCDHDHTAFRATIAQLAPKFVDAGRAILDGRDTPHILRDTSELGCVFRGDLEHVNRLAANNLVWAVLELREARRAVA